nr:hypothetical protein [Tanacetum cinerariifolium]
GDVVDGHGGEGDGVVDVTVGRWLYGGDEGAGWGGSGCCHGRLSRLGGVIRGGKRRLWRGVVVGGIAWCRRRGSGVDEGGKWRRVMASDIVDRIDRVTGSNFGFAGKLFRRRRRGGRRWWPAGQKFGRERWWCVY